MGQISPSGRVWVVLNLFINFRYYYVPLLYIQVTPFLLVVFNILSAFRVEIISNFQILQFYPLNISLCFFFLKRQSYSLT